MGRKQGQLQINDRWFLRWCEDTVNSTGMFDASICHHKCNITLPLQHCSIQYWQYVLIFGLLKLCSDSRYKLQLRWCRSLLFLPAARLHSTLNKRINSRCCSAPVIILSQRKVIRSQLRWRRSRQFPLMSLSNGSYMLSRLSQEPGVTAGRAGGVQLVICRDSRCLYLQTELVRWEVWSWNKRVISSALYECGEFFHV